MNSTTLRKKMELMGAAVWIALAAGIMFAIGSKVGEEIFYRFISPLMG